MFWKVFAVVFGALIVFFYGRWTKKPRAVHPYDKIPSPLEIELKKVGDNIWKTLLLAVEIKADNRIKVNRDDELGVDSMSIWREHGETTVQYQNHQYKGFPIVIIEIYPRGMLKVIMGIDRPVWCRYTDVGDVCVETFYFVRDFKLTPEKEAVGTFRR